MVENEITCSMKLHENDLTHTTGNRSVFPIDPYSVSLQIGVEAAEAVQFGASIMQVDANLLSKNFSISSKDFKSRQYEPKQVRNEGIGIRI